MSASVMHIPSCMIGTAGDAPRGTDHRKALHRGAVTPTAARFLEQIRNAFAPVVSTAATDRYRVVAGPCLAWLVGERTSCAQLVQDPT